MAVGLVRRALASILQTKELFLDLEKKAKILTDCLTMMESDSKDFEEFCEALNKAIQDIFTSKSRLRLPSRKRERFWCSFHQKRIDVLPAVWRSFASVSGVKVHPFLEQKINSFIFETYFKSEMETTEFCSSSIKKSVLPELNMDEINALVYVSGYIPFKLLRKYEKIQSSAIHVQQYVECLGNMAGVGPDTCLSDYARKWMDLINRGGLFPVNKPTFDFFMQVERLINGQLEALLLPTNSKTECVTKDSLIGDVVADEEVLYLWSQLSADITDEEDGMKLLHEIITLWLTIRGHSRAAAWIEEIKQEQNSAKKRTKALRSDLKKKVNDGN